jgi:hypothetical protein
LRGDRRLREKTAWFDCTALSGYQLPDYLLQPGGKMNLCTQLALIPFLFLSPLLGNGSAAAPLNFKDVIAAASALMRFPANGTAVTD